MVGRWQGWADLAPAGGRGGGIQMIVQGEYIYILYGTVLAQLSAETLELKAKVDLRELLLGDEAAVRQRRGDRGGRRAMPGPPAEPAVAPPPAEDEAEAAPGAPAQP